MSVWLHIILIIIGLVLLQQGAGWFVQGSAGLARKLKVSELAIGLTIVAATKRHHDIAVGNIIGFNPVINIDIAVLAGGS